MRRPALRFPSGKLFLIPVVSLLIYTLLGFFVLPYLVRWYVPRFGRDQLKCTAAIGKVSINPFLLTLEANDFNLMESDGTPIAGFGRFFLALEVGGFLHRTTRLKEVVLEKPVLSIAVEPDGSLNLAKLAPQSSEPESKASPASDPARLVLDRFSLTGGGLKITDKRQDSPVTVEFQDISLDLKTLSTIRNQSGKYSLSAGTLSGETFRWEGEVCLLPFRSSGKIDLSGIQTKTLWDFSKSNLNLDPPAGTIDISADYNIDASDPVLNISAENFKTKLSGFALKLAGKDEVFFELKSFDLGPTRFDLVSKKLEVGKILAEGGKIQLRIDPAGKTNFHAVVRHPGTPKESTRKTEESAAPSPVPDAQPWMVDVQAIEIKDIELSLEDQSRESPVFAGISKISVSSSAKIEAGPETKAQVRGLAVELDGMKLGNKGIPQPLFEARKFTLEGGEVDLSSRTAMVSRIGLSDGRLDIVRDREGRINLERLFASREKATEVTGSRAVDGQQRPWKFLVKAFEAAQLRSDLSDLGIGEKPVCQVKDLHVRATEIDGKSPMAFALDFEIEKGGKVSLSGKVDPATLSVDASVGVHGLQLNPLQPYLEPFIALTLQSAVLSTEGTLRWSNSEAGPKMAYEGNFGMEKFSLSEPGSKETYLGWGSMKIPGLKLGLEPNNFKADEIRISKPVGRLIIAEDRTVNLAGILREQPSVKTPREKPKDSSKKPAAVTANSGKGRKESGKSFPFNIAKVRIEDGDVVFADLSLIPKFMARIHDLKGTIDRVSSEPNVVSKIQLDGIVDKYGLARVNGSMDFSDYRRSTDIDVIFRNVEMASITPYSGKFAGRRIKSGKLSTNLKYQIQENKLVGDNKIIVDNLVLGEHVQSPNAVNLPLDLAVALLSDSNGRIEIGLPVSGDLNDPQFSIAPLVWKAVTALLTKSVTAPFRALGSLFGGDAQKFDSVQFDPGKAELLPPEKEKLKKVAEVLQKRPRLNLTVQGRYSPETDGVELKQASVLNAIASGSGREAASLDLGDPKTRSALEKMFAERFGKGALEELDRAVKKGEVKPREIQPEDAKKKKTAKKGKLAGIMNAVKVYKVIPGMKSPEQSEILAQELFARLVESEPVPEKSLLELASNRAQAITAELKGANSVDGQRIQTVQPETLEGDEGSSAKLSLDSLPPP
jgi:hypothetical protein